MAAGFVGVGAVVADGLLAFRWDVEKSDEVGGCVDLEVALGVVVALGAVDDGLGGGVPSDFLEGERMAEEIFGEAFPAGVVVCGDGFSPPLSIWKPECFQERRSGSFLDEFGAAEGVEKAVEEEFDGWGEVFGGHAVEAAVGSEESIDGKDMEVGVENEIVAEGVDSGHGGEFSIGEIEAGGKIAEGGGGGVEEMGEEVAAFAVDAAQDFWDGEDELAVGDFVADGGGDPVANCAGAALVAGGAEVAAFAGEGEHAFVATVGALEAGEAGSEVAAAEEGMDGGDGAGIERAEGFPMKFLVVGEEGVPAVVDDLPEERGTRVAGLVDGWHKECS